jgi:hypothetical protein
MAVGVSTNHQTFDFETSLREDSAGLCPQTSPFEKKRSAPRFAWGAEFRGVVSSEIGLSSGPIVQGITTNVGAGGIGAIGDRPLAPGTVLRCEISLGEVPVRIPTLLRVCWLSESDAPGQYKLGFAFLI